MLLAAFALAAGIADAPAPATARVVQQATATVRIVAGERISLTETPETAQVRTIVVKAVGGQAEKRRLIEFP